MRGNITAVLGCGVIGSSWVDAFSAAGHSVRIWDPVTAWGDGGVQRRSENIVQCGSAQEAVHGATFVQESGPEDLGAKRKLFTEIASSLSDNALVASSTSTLLPSDLQRGIAFADRVIVGHPFNPPHILPLVEIVGGIETSQDTLDRAMAFYIGIGKRPIRLHLERAGHLANRLQAALWREAVDAVASGQATVSDVDNAVTLALGPRWAVMGPFATFALAGGTGGLSQFFQHLGGPFEWLWDDAKRPDMTPELKRLLIEQLDEVLAGRTSDERRDVRDRRLVEVLSAAKMMAK